MLENVKKALFKVSGMHCVSCAMNIDGTLEDLPGVVKAETNYAKAQTNVEFDDQQTNLDAIKEAIAKTGYIAEIGS
jgi:Cu+-exporting ATPase